MSENKQKLQGKQGLQSKQVKGQVLWGSKPNEFLSAHALLDMSLVLEEAVNALPWDSDTRLRAQVTLSTWETQIERAREVLRA